MTANREWVMVPREPTPEMLRAGFLSKSEGFGIDTPADAPGLVYRAMLAAAPQERDAGEVSDGYHTFNELYAHRVRLFSQLIHAHSDKAWWSRQHDDGSKWDGWIVAGIDTPAGPATYHLPETEIPNLPAGTETERGKPWDGHTAADVLDRLLSLGMFPFTSPASDAKGVKEVERASARYPSNAWPEVDRVLLQAYIDGEHGVEFDMIAARAAIIAASRPASDVGVDGLRALVAKWRGDAEKQRDIAVRHQRRGEHAAADVHFEHAQDANAYADELEAALSQQKGNG